MDVSTSQFEFAHGKRPRGNGAWAFFLERTDGSLETVWFGGMYSAAKAKALAYARKHGFTKIEVGP